MIRVSCHGHCSASAEFRTVDEAVSNDWRHVIAGTDQTGIEEAWFCPRAPSAHLSRFLESKLPDGSAKVTSRIRE